MLNHISHIIKRNHVLPEEKHAVIVALLELNALANELIGIDSPEILAARIADEGYQAHIENSPELYGMDKLREVDRYGHLYNDPTAAPIGAGCDVELDEISK